MKRLLVVISVVIVGVVLWFAYTRNHNGHTSSQSYEQVEFLRQDLKVTFEATGIVEPENRLEIKPPIGGRIEQVLAEEGESVEEGDIIAWMSSTERATLLDAARTEGEAVLAKWKRVYKATPIIAPLSGTIIARSAEPGQTLTVQDVVFVLSDRLIINAQVDETDIGMVSEGQEARGTLDAYPDISVAGTVSHVAFEAVTVNNVTIYEVEVIPDTIPRQMKSGMTATVEFLVARADDVLTLPVDAVSVSDGKSVVLVSNDETNSQPEQWRVLTGLKSGGRIEVLSGLKGHEKVVKRSFSIPTKKETGSSPFMPSRKKK